MDDEYVGEGMRSGREGVMCLDEEENRDSVGDGMADVEDSEASIVESVREAKLVVSGTSPSAEELVLVKGINNIEPGSSSDKFSLDPVSRSI